MKQFRSLQFFKLDIVARLRCLLFGLGCGFRPVSLLLLAHMFVHAALHFPEALLHLPGGNINWNDKPEYQQVTQVNKESV